MGKEKCDYDGCTKEGTEQRGDFIGNFHITLNLCRTHDDLFDKFQLQVLNGIDKGEIVR